MNTVWQRGGGERWTEISPARLMALCGERLESGLPIGAIQRLEGAVCGFGRVPAAGPDGEGGSEGGDLRPSGEGAGRAA